MINMNCGVYKILCVKNKKFYIGGSVNIKRRWKEHKLMLNKNIHHTKHLQNAWNKYGESAFEFTIIEHTTEDQVESREKDWIEHLNSNDKTIGFNVRYKSREGTWLCDSMCKDYIVIHPNGKEESIKGMNAFARAYDLSQGAMIAIANHKLNIHHGFHCRYADETFEQWTNVRKNIIDINKKNKAPMSTKNMNGYKIIDPSGNEIEIKSLTDFCIQNNLSQGNMTEVAKGRRKQHKGYRCSYLNSIK